MRYLKVSIRTDIKNNQGSFLEGKKEKEKIAISDLPPALREIADIPAEGHGEAAPSAQPDRPRTQKEQELDSLIAKRQGIIEKLKANNAIVAECRKNMDALIPQIRGKGSNRAFGLMRELERLEFAISTEADTPKKEKELIKQVREVKKELSTHKELEATQKKIDEQRRALHSAISDIRDLEHQLADARKSCDEAYAAVITERKSAYEGRQKKRDEKRHKEFSDLQERVGRAKKKEYDDEIGKYMKDYDDTVSMEEICIIEKKERKKEEDSKEE